ncbi:protein FAM3D isoform X2 [Ochotona princeps]|uniref:protein FAM3D isoform X2 n=1 Tax=Ochotona princeps TaxID=9978 RepID=UPI002714F641|nr:protein FAM3D isoform X2 [Ochotona princeps]
MQCSLHLPCGLWCCGLLAASPCSTGLLRMLALTFVLVTTLIFVRSYINFTMRTIRLPRWMGLNSKETETPKTKCGLSKTCPSNFFAFKISSGAANVVGPSMCFENQIIMSPVKNNVGRGLNIALVNGTTGLLLRHSSFDMYSGDTKPLLQFLTEIPGDTLVLVASYDDPGTKMTEEIRKRLSDLGSTYAKDVGFRDSWVFLGARDLKSKSPFEQYLKNSPETNKYEGWPELLEMEGCVPRKIF